MFIYLLGNAYIHRLTSRGATELRIDLVNYKWRRGYAKYSSFSVTNARDQYRLKVSGYSGNAGKFNYLDDNNWFNSDRHL